MYDPLILRHRSRQSTVTAGVLLEQAVFDANYIGRLKRGDPETGDHFTAYFANAIWLKLRNRVRASYLIEEIQQETFARVLKYVRSGRIIEHPERFGAFVLSVCNNVMLEVLRSESHHVPHADDTPDPVDERILIDRQIVTDERKRAVRSILEELSEKDRRLLRMTFMEDIDRSEISEHFQVETDYLRVLLHRAKERFREVVRKKGKIAGL